jgi:phosphomannomutase
VLIYAVKKYNLAGGIIITASHNPIDWNALKFVKSGGFFLNQDDLDNLLSLDVGAVKKCDYKTIGKNILDYPVSEFVNIYTDDLLSHFDVNAIKDCGFKVLYDPVNSTSECVTPYLLEKLGCTFEGINTDITKGFMRGAEPLSENLSWLCGAVKEKGFDVGFAHDPDGDRLALVDDRGIAIGEEYTLGLGVYQAYKNRGYKGDICVNLSTSMLSSKIAEKFLGKTYQAKVGEINVTELMCEKNIGIGGEGNGGVIFPDFNNCRDSFVSIAFVLELLAKEKKTLSRIVSGFDSFIIKKDKINLPADFNFSWIYEKIKKFHNSCVFNEDDGLKVEGKDFWVHIRPSNTEPVVRIISESKDEEKSIILISEIKDIFIAK